MKTRTPLLLLCAIALASHAETTRREMWVWKDANGVNHSSDKPEPGAKKIELVGTSPSPSSQDSLSPRPSSAPASEGKPPSESASEQAPAVDVRYESLEIAAPEDEQTFYSAEGIVPVTLASKPTIADADRMVIYLDGKLANTPENSYQATLYGVERGEHVLTASILDARGNAKIDSAPRKFYVQFNPLNNPRNLGPALKPKPVPLPAPAPPPPPKSSK